MAWFNFKKKKIVLRCVTNRLDVASVAPVTHANKCFPDWWKALPKQRRDKTNRLVTTLKTCYGLTNHYSRGVIIPMWCDLEIELGPNADEYRYQYSDLKSTALVHSTSQRGSYLDPSLYQHLKLDSPWRFYCDEKVDFIFQEPTWSMDNLNNYRILPGTVDFRYQHATNINMMLPRDINNIKSFIIPLGQPLIHIIPCDNREIKLEIVSDPDEYRYLENKEGQGLTFVNRYLNRRRLEEKHEAESKCPFGFGKK